MNIEASLRDSLRLRADSVDPVPDWNGLGTRMWRARRRRRRMFAGAFAVVVIAGATVLAVWPGDATRSPVRTEEPTSRPDEHGLPNDTEDGPAVTSGTQSQYLLPGWLPHGVEPIQAMRFGDVPEVGGEVVAYGRADAEDPWDGSVLAAFHIAPSLDTFFGEGGTDGPPIGGRLSRMRQDAQGWLMEWSIDGGLMVVRGIGVSREQVIAAAQAASVEPAIDPAGLPDGLIELVRGPVHAALPWGDYTGSSMGLWVSYGDEAVGSEESTTMLLKERRQGTAAVVDLFRLAYPETRPVDIRGQHAILGWDTTGFLALQWYEPSGLLVTLTAWGLTEDTLRRVAEELREPGSDKLERLLADHPACPERGFWTEC